MGQDTDAHEVLDPNEHRRLCGDYPPEYPPGNTNGTTGWTNVTTAT